MAPPEQIYSKLGMLLWQDKKTGLLLEGPWRDASPEGLAEQYCMGGVRPKPLQ